MPENKFGYKKMLDIETEFNPSDDNLNQLAEFMAVDRERIPAGYTYLGQFIDHDISLDSATVDRKFPGASIPASSIFNLRSPFLNLETIYGFETPTNDGEPKRADLLKEGSKTLLKLGDTVPGLIVKKIIPDKDLPRKPNCPIALIVDPRNDENLAVAQTQVAFMRFHNAVVNLLHPAPDTTETFEKAREIVIGHYQWIILYDFLPRIIKKSVVDDVLENGNKFYFPDPQTPFIPLEFAVAAYRAGHSMIRNSYNWNPIFNDGPFPDSLPATLNQLSENTGRGGLGRNNNLLSDWLINWNWFYDLSGNRQNQNLNLTSLIDTNIAHQLGFLPPRTSLEVLERFARETSLPALDLYRSRALGLPTGQAVAQKILGSEDLILKPGQIANLLPALPKDLKKAISAETPLWFYLLAEAEIEEQGQRLGEVGSRIIAETFVGLIKLSRPSILDGSFRPNTAFCTYTGEFGMREMFKVISRGNTAELNPVGEAIKEAEREARRLELARSNETINQTT
jgi:hypothetical protein